MSHHEEVKKIWVTAGEKQPKNGRNRCTSGYEKQYLAIKISNGTFREIFLHGL
jgi:hypothetical protein